MTTIRKLAAVALALNLGLAGLAQATPADDIERAIVADNDLTLKQISFLQEEVAHLEQELAATRAEFVKGRTDCAGA